MAAASGSAGDDLTLINSTVAGNTSTDGSGGGIATDNDKEDHRGRL